RRETPPIPTQMIENRAPIDRAILVGAPTKDVSQRASEEHLEELARLTHTAGGEVASTLRQRIDRPSPRFYIGEGKALELKSLLESSEANLVIFDEELSPAQGKNLEDLLGVRVLDRSELILDIFATRARSREAKLQVELAQLEYLLPRLRRMWSHLSRIRGGIGLRGPGETQLETDRRLIGTRISDLKVKLREVAKARAVQRKARAGEYRAAIVGYTNAGKSSLLRALSGADLFVEDRLFATLDSATRMVDLGSGHQALLTDTVGFIRKLPHHLIASFRSTLEEAREADLLLHVIDASDPDWEEHREVVYEVLEELDLTHRPQLLVFNKTDLLTHGEEEGLKTRIRTPDKVPAVFVSAHRPESLHKIRDALKARLRAGLYRLRVSLPAGDGETMAAIYREGEVLSQRSDGSRVEIEARIPKALKGRLEQNPGIEFLSDS
ncbi:MAG: GTPase HflX, partial [Longimicrobiales bacterium]|nr:GTPase HflX [Longimicrobiales bacterium]